MSPSTPTATPAAPIAPMLAKRVDAMPDGTGWIFEPKWDGFRTLIFRNGPDLLLQSRDLKPLNRYFPELVEPLLAQLPDPCILDGEIVIAGPHGLDFDSLQLRIHPAASRIRLLAQQTPAAVIAFDLLAAGPAHPDLRETPFAERRALLEDLLAGSRPPIHLTPATRDRVLATDWFHRFEGAGLDGVIAKPESLTYQPNKRAMLKIKHERDCDCVVAGFRWYKESEGTAVGSLMLGLFDDQGTLRHVGVCASFTAPKRRELLSLLEPFRDLRGQPHPWADAADGISASGASLPGASSRWNQGKDLSWIPLRPELVLEVAYEHMQGSRFRHMAQFRRWRPDKPAADCTYAQLETVPPHELQQIFASPAGSSATKPAE